MEIAIRALDGRDVAEADRIFRVAFGTFLGLPKPDSFMGDADLVGSRWWAAPTAVLGAYAGDELVGSNFVANWGSFGFFGPLTVRPDLWDRGIARRLLDPTMELFTRWGTRQAGLFTFPNSPKHIALYEKFGFRRQALTPVMAKAVGGAAGGGQWSTLSAVPRPCRPPILAACQALTEAIHPGLDVQSEIRAVCDQRIGETVLVREGRELVAFAVCHQGAGSEAEAGATFIKFGAARAGRDAPGHFERLLAACEAQARVRGSKRLVAGINVARSQAHRIMRRQGFETVFEGVAMHRPDAPGHNRPDCFVIDDWR
ncbi:MAG: GNAT family N-acetyltransferase [Reyranellaceae bacterium]